MYASAQFLDFLDLEQKFSFLDWKLPYVQHWCVDGHSLAFCVVQILAFNVVLNLAYLAVSWLAYFVEFFLAYSVM